VDKSSDQIYTFNLKIIQMMFYIIFGADY